MENLNAYSISVSGKFSKRQKFLLRRYCRIIDEPVAAYIRRCTIQKLKIDVKEILSKNNDAYLDPQDKRMLYMYYKKSFSEYF
jgi:hypothetical protein